MRLSYEPAAVASALAVLFQAAALFGWLPDAFDGARVSEALVLLATGAVGLYVRSRAYPAAKIEDAARVDESFEPGNIHEKAWRGRRRKEMDKEAGASV